MTEKMKLIKENKFINKLPYMKTANSKSKPPQFVAKSNLQKESRKRSSSVPDVSRGRSISRPRIERGQRDEPINGARPKHVIDDILWLKLDGNLFNLSDDVFLWLIYNVPEGSSRQGLLDNMNLFDRLSDHMIHIKNLTDNKCQFLVCGDFNARTSDLADYVQDDTAVHILVPPDDYSTDLPLKRVSEDKGFNRYGSELLDFCKQTGLRILNGRARVDGNIGKCTYVGSTGRSLVDYVIVSQEIFSLVDNLSVSDPNILSDHCIVNFSLCSDINFDNNLLKTWNRHCNICMYRTMSMLRLIKMP